MVGHEQQERHGVTMLAEGRMAPAEVARTITSLVTYGTLSTVDSEGVPLGTFVTFVLDDKGCPLIRLRSDAAHTANLKTNKRCTIFAHASEKPARQLARVTLLGEVDALTGEEASEAAARHAVIYRSAIGVDAPHSDDTFMRLNVQKCFFVAGLGV
jgi:putative heme iron utilization protein